MIPNIFHFVFGMANDFGGKEFSLSHYIAIKSAVSINKPDKIYFHYAYEPSGEWWEKTKPYVILNKVVAPETFMGCKIYHVAHKADIIRLQMLKKYGGVYLDLDTICVKPLHHLYNHSFVIGQELKSPYVPKNYRQHIKHTLKNIFFAKKQNVVNGLCNAVMLSTPCSEFLDHWLNEYAGFRSKGYDKYWNELSVFVPQKLAAVHQHLVTVVGPYNFHFPLYNEVGLQQMFETKVSFPEALVHHLWQSVSWNKYLSKLTPEYVQSVNTTYNLIARSYL
jgi:hypothetical protein